MQMPFGTYQGQHLEDILVEDPNYLRWIEENIKKLDPDLWSEINRLLEAQNSRTTSVGRVVRKGQ